MGIIAAMEEIQNELGSEDLEQAVDTAVEVAGDQAELKEQASDVAGDVSEVEAAVADTDELQAIGDVAQEAVESGEGLSEQAAEVATIAIERIHQRLGFRGKQRIVPATESFGHANTRLASTKLVLEGIVDTIKSVWNAIKAMAKRIWDKIVSIFAKVTGSGRMLRDQIENLKKRAEKISPAAEMKEKELANKSLAKKLSVGKKADKGTYQELAKNAAALSAAAQSLTDAAARKAKLVRNILETVSGPNVTKETVEEVLKRGNKDDAMKTALSKVTVLGKQNYEPKDKKDGVDVAAYGVFIGNQTIFVTTESSKDGSVDSRVGFGFGSLKDDEVADKADALSASEILAVLKTAGEMASKIEDQKKIEKEGEDVSKNIIAACDKLLASVGKLAENTSSDIRRGFADAKDGVQECFSILNAMGAQAPTIYYNTAALGAEYASASLANFKS